MTFVIFVTFVVLMERETLDVDVLIVGGGPAGLSAAIRLAQLQAQHGGEPLSIAVLEKAREAGAHMLSGAVLDPSALRDLIPDFREKGAPLAAEVKQRPRLFPHAEVAASRFRSSRRRCSNHGNYIISLNQFVRWLAEQAEGQGVDFFTGFAGQDVLDRRATASSACAPAIGASAGTASRSRRSSRASTSTPRSRSSATACAAT